MVRGSQTRDIVVVGAARTAIGSFNGSLKDIPLTQLATKAVSAALARSGADPATIDHVVMGNVIPTEPADAYLGRIAAVNSGIPYETPAFNVNRLCGSGLQAIISAAEAIQFGDAELAIGAGAESMSRSPYFVQNVRPGQKMGNIRFIDYMLGILHDPFHKIHMGVTAENLAERYGISREEQDMLAVESHHRAARATKEGRFKDQIVPIELTSRHRAATFDKDEHIRAETTLEALAAMKPAFKKDGTVTAGNASGINDGAAAVVLADAQKAAATGLTPLARLVGYAHAGVAPDYMGIGPVPATRKLLAKTGINIRDIDIIESNEAFAAQACAVAKELNFDPARVNPNGSGISLGHPVGATGALIAVKAIYELHRTQKRYALVTMCIGGGQGIAAIFERV